MYKKGEKRVKNVRDARIQDLIFMLEEKEVLKVWNHYYTDKFVGWETRVNEESQLSGWPNELGSLWGHRV